MQENRENTGPEVDQELNEAELDEVTGGQSDPDSLSEMSQIDTMRMQMTMDRMTKTTQAQTNTVKKAAQANSTIVQNLK